VIHSLGTLRWETPNVDGWRSFGVDVLGMMLADGPEPDALYFRTDDRPYRLVVAPGDEARLVVGFEVVDDRALAELARALDDAGVKYEPGSEEEARRRLVNGFIRFEDPGGVAVEAYHGPILDHTPVVTPLVSGFVTGAMGFGHVVLGVTDAAAAAEFYRETLRFSLRNTMRIDLGAGPATMHFLSCNARHHTVGLMGFPMPGNLVHFMLEAKSLDDVGRALDRVNDAGVPLAMTLGRHTNDHMVSFYCVSPDGAMVEFGWGGMQVPEPETTYEITKVSFWGHRPPATGTTGA
jgi:3,4-dihydroxy-9,10-secoandrosta-1,3,5(10)-triene-9,17-dione 4,5-dioxygenase